MFEGWDSAQSEGLPVCSLCWLRKEESLRACLTKAETASRALLEVYGCYGSVSCSLTLILVSSDFPMSDNNRRGCKLMSYIHRSRVRQAVCKPICALSWIHRSRVRQIVYKLSEPSWRSKVWSSRLLTILSSLEAPISPSGPAEATGVRRDKVSCQQSVP